MPIAKAIKPGREAFSPAYTMPEKEGTSFPAPPLGPPPGRPGSAGRQARLSRSQGQKTRPQADKAPRPGTFAACRRFSMFQMASGPYFFTRRALIRSPSVVTYTVRHVA